MQLSLILVCELAYMCVAMSVHVEMGLSYWLSPLKCLDWYFKEAVSVWKNSVAEGKLTLLAVQGLSRLLCLCL